MEIIVTLTAIAVVDLLIAFVYLGVKLGGEDEDD